VPEFIMSERIRVASSSVAAGACAEAVSSVAAAIAASAARLGMCFLSIA
jgi:hypothetical protein